VPAPPGPPSRTEERVAPGSSPSAPPASSAAPPRPLPLGRAVPASSRRAAPAPTPAPSRFVPLIGTAPRDESGGEDDRHDPRGDDQKRREGCVPKLFVHSELKGARRQRVEVEGAQDEGEGEFLEDIHEDEEGRRGERPPQEGEIDPEE